MALSRGDIDMYTAPDEEITMEEVYMPPAVPTPRSATNEVLPDTDFLADISEINGDYQMDIEYQEYDEMEVEEAAWQRTAVVPIFKPKLAAKQLGPKQEDCAEERGKL